MTLKYILWWGSMSGILWKCGVTPFHYHLLPHPGRVITVRVPSQNQFPVWKLFVLDRNTWNHMTLCKSFFFFYFFFFLLDKNAWYHITVCKPDYIQKKSPIKKMQSNIEDIVITINHLRNESNDDYHQIGIAVWNHLIACKLLEIIEVYANY